MADQSPEPQNKDVQRKNTVTWDRSIEILKVVATVWAAVIGTFVTMQFNERQHELARIEAIAKMLPHLTDTRNAGDVAGKSGSKESAADRTNGSSGSPMTRDGAIWAIFRTANNKVMLRDLASLFPEDIYRVVSSIAVAGSLQQDEDAIIALQVASEKLASHYSDKEHRELAARLYSQAVRLKQRRSGSPAPVYIVDLNEREVESPHGEDTTQSMLSAINQLGDLHVAEADRNRKINAGHWQAKQLYKRVRNLGSDAETSEAKLEVVKADLGLYNLYRKEDRLRTARAYLAEALELQKSVLGKEDPHTRNSQALIDKLDDELGKSGIATAPAAVPKDSDDEN